MSDVESGGASPPTRRKVLAVTALVTAHLALPGSLIAATEPRKAKPVFAVDLERFVEDCVAANRETDAQAAVREVLARAVANPKAVTAALGEPRKAGIRILHQSATLTIFNANWTPQMNLMPHNHLMWANIGIFTGREDNIYWERTPGTIRATGADALFEKDTAALPADVMHSVTNPLQRFTGGIHIYGGDFFNTRRSQWHPETRLEEPSDGAAIRKIFDKENQRLGLN